MNILDTIKDILKENLNIDPACVNESSTFDSLGIDSLDLVELVFELENRLNIDFGDPENLKTVGDVIKYIESL